MSVVTEVKERTDIVELISEHVSLQKSGRNFKGLCPFHSEKHPSFFVYPEQQTWHCFGACGTGGDAISFVMQMEQVDFGQALHVLAERAGVSLQRAAPQPREVAGEEERLLQINEAVTEYYHHLLLTSRAGEAARHYLADRNISVDTIKAFRLGFSPDRWDAAKDYLLPKGYSEAELLQVGLTTQKEGGNSYDRFRNRLMFPICDIEGRVTGFGARAMDESSAKYINSPQTTVFDKSSSLYAIDKAAPEIRKRNSVIIVEGYMDALALHQIGWRAVVASMGTSMTARQAEVTKKLTKNIVLALDADAAGEQATLRGAEVLAASLDKKPTPIPLWSGLVKYESVLDADIRVIGLPPGEDPDQVVNRDASSWQKLVEQAVPILDFAFGVVADKLDTSSAKDKSLAIEKLLPLLEEIKDPIRHAHYVDKLARLLKLGDSGPVLQALSSKARIDRRRRTTPQRTERSRAARPLVSDPTEEYCLALLLQYPDLREGAGELSVEHFAQSEHRELFNRWKEHQDMAALQSQLDAGLLEHLYYLIGKDFPPAIREGDKARRLDLGDCILRLQEKLCRRLEAEKQTALEVERGRGGTESELSKLDEQGICSGQQLHEIFVRRGSRRWTQ